MAMKDRSILELEIAKLVSDILGETVGIEGTRDTVPAWDSLRHVEVIFSFEEAYGLRLTESEMASLRSVKDLAERAMKG
jgi:acyl carrier protein